MFAYYLHDLSPFVVQFPNGWGLRWYGLAYVGAFYFGYLLYRWLSKRGFSEVRPESVSDFITWAAVFGVMLGGRLGWVLFYGIRQNHAADPWYWPFAVWEGGMSSHGGILGLVLFTWYYARRHRISWTSIGDSLVVAATIGLFLVRMANFINGELYGKPSTVSWAVQFPTEIPAELRPPLTMIQNDTATREHLQATLPSRHPSQIYEGLLEGVVLFLVLWVLRTRFRVPRGVLTGVFFILYAGLRIVGEIFREPDPTWSAGPLSAGQFLSLFMVVIGVGFLLWAWRTRQYEIGLPAGGNVSKKPAAAL